MTCASASKRLAKLLVQKGSVLSPRAKGISIGEASSGGADPSVSELKEEIGVMNHRIIERDVLIDNLKNQVSELKADNSLKTTQIFDLQTRLGALTACYFDLKNKLTMEFGDKFKSSVGEPGKAKTSTIDLAQASHQEPPVDPPTVRTTRLVD